MKEPLVSVLMPVYNGETTIQLAIRSLLLQSWKRWECIIVNDGSTDGTKDILANLVDKRFRVINLSKNMGRGHAREIALENANGDYITYLDADDLIHSEKLYAQTMFLEKHQDVDLVGCGGITMSKEYTAQKTSSLCDIKISSSTYRYGAPLPLLMASIMVRCPRAKEIPYDHTLDVGEDFDYISRYLDGGIYANLPLPYYYYLTGTYTGAKIISYQVKILKMWKKFLCNGAFKRGCIGLLQSVIKICAYAVLLPILGVDRMMYLRGHGITLTEKQIRDFEEQKKHIIDNN